MPKEAQLCQYRGQISPQPSRTHTTPVGTERGWAVLRQREQPSKGWVQWPVSQARVGRASLVLLLPTGTKNCECFLAA